MNAQQDASPLDEFKSCLMDSSQAQFSLQEKYLELSAQKEGSIVIWNPKSSWFVEAEINNKDGSFLQRKVIMELSPDDFFVLPPNLPDHCVYLQDLMRMEFATLRFWKIYYLR